MIFENAEREIFAISIMFKNCFLKYKFKYKIYILFLKTFTKKSGNMEALYSKVSLIGLRVGWTLRQSETDFLVI